MSSSHVLTQVDTELVTRLANVARSKLSSISLTFHRAIDMTPDIHKSAETIVSLGFDRILTSGGKKTAYLGVDNISKMVSDLGKSIIVMPGSGITEVLEDRNSSNPPKII